MLNIELGGDAGGTARNHESIVRPHASGDFAASEKREIVGGRHCRTLFDFQRIHIQTSVRVKKSGVGARLSVRAIYLLWNWHYGTARYIRVGQSIHIGDRIDTWGYATGIQTWGVNMKHKETTDSIVHDLVIAAIPFLVYASIYRALPSEIPVHYSLKFDSGYLFYS